MLGIIKFGRVSQGDPIAGRMDADPSRPRWPETVPALPVLALHQLRRQDLEPLDALWHLLNFFAPALGVGILAPTLAKLLWRSELRAIAWSRLVAVAVGAAALALIGGLLVLGQDGRIATYGAMVAATASGLWWVGFRPFS
jgi:hypothetical protein